MTPISWLLPLLASIPAIVLAAPTPVAPIHRVERRAESGGFIVKFKPSAVPKENRLVWVNNQLRRAGCQPLTTTQAEGLKLGWSEEVFDGFAGSFDSCPNAINIIRTSGDVEYISEDGESWLTAITTQNNAPWGLQRLSQQSPLGRTDDGETNFVYTFDDSAGEGVDIYIVDTGVQVDHPEFGGRAQFLETFGTGVPGVDVHGHGTHVAGIAGSQTYGVAKNANIFAVKVMSDSGRGDTSNIIAGVNFAVGRAFTTNRRRPSIINISIISNRTPALDEAVANAARLGVHVIVGSGNDNVDASNFSPARSPDAITVGATNIRDQKASFSNFGAPVDIFAPGENILSLAPGSTTQVLSGTSMATPFISGLVAYIIALEGDQTPAAMKTRIQNLSSPGLIAAVPNGTVNELAWNGAQVAQEAPPAAAPTQQVSGPNQAQIQLVLNSVDGVLESLRALSDAASRAEL